MKRIICNLLLLTLLSNFTLGCHKGDNQNPDPAAAPQNSGQSQQVTAGFPEDFEGDSKGSYAAGTATFGSGTWTLDDALVGDKPEDAKNGSRSIRMRETGKLSMNFDVPKGAVSVTVKHAVYHNDGGSTWELWASTNQGRSYTKVGNTITTSSPALKTASFTVNFSGTVRFEIRKLTGGSNRINFDDFSIQEVKGSSGTNTGGGTSVGTDNTHLALGNPSNAVSDPANITNYLMTKPEYALSYHRDRGTPNWVSWYVGSAWLGNAPRQDDFRPDGTLPAGWYQVSASNYTGSGFDRGHNCPSADRSNTPAANSATFLMTNMIPQAPNNNQQTWSGVESYTRSLVNAGKEVYVIMGSYGTGANGANGYATTIGNGKITVPKRVWRIMVILENGNNDLSRINTSTRVIAIDTPNDNSVDPDWGKYRTSVKNIEKATGYNLLSNLPAALQTTLEAKVDNGPTN